MKCFVHADADAVGTCTSCHRGLWRAFAVEFERGLACRNRCEAEVRRLLDLRDFGFSQPSTQRHLIQRQRQAFTRNGLFMVVFGAIMCAMYFVDSRFTFLAATGAVLILFGVAIMLLSRKVPQSEQFRLCPHCGYNLTGNTTGKCSECGKIA